ncbi:MAG: rod shape-determining protein MreD [Acidimicrobiales bacterium]|nr:rod shape-determining protein MreD [Acidimicrobiales bacterium]
MTDALGTRARLGLLVASAAVLQRGVFSHFHIFGVSPDILLLLAIAAGLTSVPERGAIVGFFAGLAFDFVIQGLIGLGALAFCLTGYVAGRMQGLSVRTSRWVPMASAAIASIIGELLYVGVGQLVGQSHLMTDRVPRIVVVVAVVNALLAPIALRVLRWAWRVEPGYRPAYW